MKTESKVKIEISVKMLTQLFANGHLCAADIHCLNAQSKAKVWRLCLIACANSNTCSIPSQIQSMVLSKTQAKIRSRFLSIPIKSN